VGDVGVLRGSDVGEMAVAVVDEEIAGRGQAIILGVLLPPMKRSG